MLLTYRTEAIALKSAVGQPDGQPYSTLSSCPAIHSFSFVPVAMPPPTSSAVFVSKPPVGDVATDSKVQC